MVSQAGWGTTQLVLKRKVRRMGGVCVRTANAGECEGPRSRAVWRRRRWAMKCLGRQTRPTYSPERRALHLFGNRFPLRPEYRPVLSCAWYDTISRKRDVAAGPGWASPGTSSWDLMKRLNAATAGSCMDCMEPERSMMRARFNGVRLKPACGSD